MPCLFITLLCFYENFCNALNLYGTCANVTSSKNTFKFIFVYSFKTFMLESKVLYFYNMAVLHTLIKCKHQILTKSRFYIILMYSVCKGQLVVILTLNYIETLNLLYNNLKIIIKCIKQFFLTFTALWKTNTKGC